MGGRRDTSASPGTPASPGSCPCRSTVSAADGFSDTTARAPTPIPVAGASHAINAEDTTRANANDEEAEPPPINAGDSNRHEPTAWRCAPVAHTTPPPAESTRDGATPRRTHALAYSNDLAPLGVTTGRPFPSAPPSAPPAAAPGCRGVSGHAFAVVMVIPTAMNPPAGRPKGGVTQTSVSPSGETLVGRIVCGPNWHAMSVVKPRPWKVTRVPPSAGPRLGRRSSAYTSPPTCAAASTEGSCGAAAPATRIPTSNASRRRRDGADIPWDRAEDAGSFWRSSRRGKPGATSAPRSRRVLLVRITTFPVGTQQFPPILSALLG